MRVFMSPFRDCTFMKSCDVHMRCATWNILPDNPYIAIRATPSKLERNAGYSPRYKGYICS